MQVYTVKQVQTEMHIDTDNTKIIVSDFSTSHSIINQITGQCNSKKTEDSCTMK
jgi:hypothetical protein